MEKKKIEILLSTYNRPTILKQWLESSSILEKDSQLAVAIYDSSTDDSTKELIQTYNKKTAAKIKYVHIDNNIRLDDKIMKSILESEHEYVWPMGDSRIFSYEDITKKVIPIIENGVDFCCMFNSSEASDGEVFLDSKSFFDKCFWHATLLGGIIFKKQIFEPLMDIDCLDKWNKKYYKNDGFSYLGVFYDLIANKRINAVFVNTKIVDIGKNKVPGWIHRYLTVWCENLVYLIDNLDDFYSEYKEDVLKRTWNVLNLDEAEWCYKAKLAGGLTSEIYEYYNSSGLLDRVSDHKDRIRFFAYSSERQAKIKYLEYKVTRKLKSGLRKLKKLVKRG